MKLGIIVALPHEAKSLRNPLSDNVQYVVAGMGEQQARLAAQQLHAAGCTHLISWGVAGGIDPQLCAGDLVVPPYVMNEQQRVVDCDNAVLYSLGRTQPAFVVPLLSVAAPITSVEEKAALFAEYAVAAIDRESFAIGTYAQEHGLLFSVVRSIVDAFDCELPKAALCAYDEQGRFYGGRLLWSLIRQPTQLRDLYRLAIAMKRAVVTLRECAVQLSSQFN